MLVKEFLDDIGEILRERFPDFRTGIFAGYIPADSHKAMQGDVIPVIDIFFFLLDKFEFFLRIIDQCTELPFVLFAERVSEKFIHFSSDISGSVLQHVLESLILTVNISQEMLCPFREMQDSGQVDDLSTCRCYIWKTF
jgi:hypothetical protein